MRTKLTASVSLLGVTLLLAGCDLDFRYLVPAAIGQFDLLRNSVPIDDAIAGGDLSEEQLAKLSLIRDVRAYAGQNLGLNIEGNYETFYNSHGDPVAFNVSASRKYAFEPMVWTFPIVGTVPYLGYFDRSAAEEMVGNLQKLDFDTFMYEIDAYSSVGFLANPVLSPMLDRDELDLADTVIHELLHSTVWRVNDTSFNESLATFYGRRGALSYFADRYPNEPERLDEATERFEDSDAYSDYLLEVYNELDDYFDSPDSEDAKIIGRETIYQSARDRYWDDLAPLLHDPDRYSWIGNLPTNNAWMLGVRRYNLELEAFDRVFMATGQDWGTSLGVFRAAAASDDPYAYLDEYAGADATTRRLMEVAAEENHRLRSTSTSAADQAQRGPCVCHQAQTLVATD